MKSIALFVLIILMNETHSVSHLHESIMHFTILIETQFNLDFLILILIFNYVSIVSIKNVI